MSLTSLLFWTLLGRARQYLKALESPVSFL
jgi:hypothetical protein